MTNRIKDFLALHRRQCLRERWRVFDLQHISKFKWLGEYTAEYNVMVVNANTSPGGVWECQNLFETKCKAECADIAKRDKRRALFDRIYFVFEDEMDYADLFVLLRFAPSKTQAMKQMQIPRAWPKGWMERKPIGKKFNRLSLQYAV